MPGVPPDAFHLLEQSFTNLSLNARNSLLPHHRHHGHRKHSSDPSIPSTKIEHLSSDEDDESNGRPLLPSSPSATIRNAHSFPHQQDETADLRTQLTRQSSGLPPTPPNMSTLAGDTGTAETVPESDSAPSPIFADGVRNALESKRSGLSTPVQHQHSPPTPDPSPPSTYASRERLATPAANIRAVDRLQRPDLSHNGSYAGSFAESFRTAREGNTQNNSPAPISSSQSQIVADDEEDQIQPHWLDEQRVVFRDMVNHTSPGEDIQEDPLHANGTHPLPGTSPSATTATAAATGSPDSPIWDGGISTMSRENSISQQSSSDSESAANARRDGVIIVTTNPEGEKTPTAEKQEARDQSSTPARDRDWNRYVSFVGSTDISPAQSSHSSRPVTRDGPVSSNDSTRSNTEIESSPGSLHHYSQQQQEAEDQRTLWPSVGLFAFSPTTTATTTTNTTTTMAPDTAHAAPITPSRLRHEEVASYSNSSLSSSPTNSRRSQESPLLARLDSLNRNQTRTVVSSEDRNIAKEARAAGRLSSMRQKGGDWDLSALTKEEREQQRHSYPVAKEAWEAKRYSRMREGGDLDTWAGKDETYEEVERTGKVWTRSDGTMGFEMEMEEISKDAEGNDKVDDDLHPRFDKGNEPYEASRGADDMERSAIHGYRGMEEKLMGRVYPSIEDNILGEDRSANGEAVQSTQILEDPTPLNEIPAPEVEESLLPTASSSPRVDISQRGLHGLGRPMIPAEAAFPGELNSNEESAATTLANSSQPAREASPPPSPNTTSVSRPLDSKPDLKEKSTTTSPRPSSRPDDNSFNSSSLNNDALYRHIRDQNARKIDALAKGNAVQVSIIDITAPKRRQTLRHVSKTESLRGREGKSSKAEQHELRHVNKHLQDIGNGERRVRSYGGGSTEKSLKKERRISAPSGIVGRGQDFPSAVGEPIAQPELSPPSKRELQSTSRIVPAHLQNSTTTSTNSNIAPKLATSPMHLDSKRRTSWVPGDDDNIDLQNHKLRRFARESGLERDLSIKRNSNSIRSTNSGSPQLRRSSREERLERHPEVARNSLEAGTSESPSIPNSSTRIIQESLESPPKPSSRRATTTMEDQRDDDVQGEQAVPPKPEKSRSRPFSNVLVRGSNENFVSPGLAPITSPRRVSEYNSAVAGATARGLAPTPFSISQFSDRSEGVELCEARGIEIYPHNNHSLLLVQQSAPSRIGGIQHFGDGCDGDMVDQSQSTTGLGIKPIPSPRYKRSPAPNNHLGVTDEELIGRPVFATPSPVGTSLRPVGLKVTPPQQQLGMGSKRNAVESPLTNPRQAPLPPRIQFIPPTPLDDDKEFISDGDGYAGGNMSRPIGMLARRESLRDRAKRYSEGFVLLRRPAGLKTIKRRHLIRVPAKVQNGIPVADEERPRNLSPNWRPVGFWESESEDEDGFHDDYNERDDEAMDAGVGRRRYIANDTQVAASQANERQLGIGRRSSIPFARRAMSLRLPTRFRSQSRSNPITRSLSTGNRVIAPKAPIESSDPGPLELPAQQEPTPEGPPMPRRSNSLSQTWRTRHGKIVTVPGTKGEMRFEYVGMQSFRNRMSEVRSAREERAAELRRDRLRKEIGLRFYHGS